MKICCYCTYTVGSISVTFRENFARKATTNEFKTVRRQQRVHFSSFWSRLISENLPWLSNLFLCPYWWTTQCSVGRVVSCCRRGIETKKGIVKNQFSMVRLFISTEPSTAICWKTGIIQKNDEKTLHIFIMRPHTLSYRPFILWWKLMPWSWKCFQFSSR